MISKHPKTEIDERLSALVDRELAARLAANNPELYGKVWELDVLPMERRLDPLQEPTMLRSRRPRRIVDALVALALVAVMVASIFAPALIARIRLIVASPAAAPGSSAGAVHQVTKHRETIVRHVIAPPQPVNRHAQTAAAKAPALHATQAVASRATLPAARLAVHPAH
ncbi:MAG: hypothetical protein M3Z41_08580, partial [Candidatus Eremiobacteraeota bacterium]|nr:hypothetical protein [Candidatus Eremiobacteraeota bacterium]